MPDDSLFPERWLSLRRAERPDSETLASFHAALSGRSLDEARLVALLKELAASTKTGQGQ
jgi:hypothetical protein